MNAVANSEVARLVIPDKVAIYRALKAQGTAFLEAMVVRAEKAALVETWYLRNDIPANRAMDLIELAAKQSKGLQRLADIINAALPAS